MKFAPDGGVLGDIDSYLHCSVNGGSIAELGTDDYYKTGNKHDNNTMTDIYILKPH